jgi:hypothetical protein
MNDQQGQQIAGAGGGKDRRNFAGTAVVGVRRITGGLLMALTTLPALVALFLYGLLPIVRNTAAGLASSWSSKYRPARNGIPIVAK